MFLSISTKGDKNWCNSKYLLLFTVGQNDRKIYMPRLVLYIAKENFFWGGGKGTLFLT